MYKDVAKLTDEERKLYEKIEFDLEEYTKDVGAQRLLHNTKVCFSVSVLYVLWTNYCTLFAGLLFSCTLWNSYPYVVTQQICIKFNFMQMRIV